MENKNIFEGAKFGDKFLTRDDRVALYIEKYDEDEEDIFPNILITQGDEYTMFYGNEGESEKDENLDIVSKYQEPIDEDKLDDYITRHYIELINTLPIPYDDCIKECIECFKIGYRKAMEG